VAHEAIIIAGPNGAGKSTLAYVIQEETNYPYLSADLIAAEMSPEDPAASRVAAGRRFAIEIAAFAERNESFIAETTFRAKSLSPSWRVSVSVGSSLELLLSLSTRPNYV
jgi:predicted ABC-type ATPase